MASSDGQRTRRFRGLSIGVPLFAASLVAGALSYGLEASLPAGTAAAASAPPPAALTQAQLTTLLRQGVATRRVPSKLVPSLTQSRQDLPPVHRNGCLVGRSATTNPASCVFGSRSSRTVVVLFGDSHAASWFSGIDAISKRLRWRLIFMGKQGCPAEDVMVGNLGGGPYTACVTWRHNSERQIAKLRPTLVVISSSEYHAYPVAGVPNLYRGDTWLNGLAATFKALRRAAGHVVYIADVPRLKQPAPDCISSHRSNVFPCTVTPREAFPSVIRRELATAKALGVVGIDPAPWFCTRARCPVIVGNRLLYQDTQHMLPEWSAFISPVLEVKLVAATR